MRSLLALTIVLGFASGTAADNYCYRSRSLYGYGNNNYEYSYHQSGYWNNRYYEAGYYAWVPTNYGGYWYKKNYGPHYGYEKIKVIYKEVEPDYYASVNSFYRDALFADAVAYRVLTAQKTGALPQQPAQTLPQYGQDRQLPQRNMAPAVRTPVSATLSKYVSESCLKCHNGPGGKGGVDLSNLETTPVGIRWACHGTVSAGEMPKGGKEAPDEIVREFYEFARAAAKQTARKDDQ